MDKLKAEFKDFSAYEAVRYKQFNENNFAVLSEVLTKLLSSNKIEDILKKYQDIKKHIESTNAHDLSYLVTDNASWVLTNLYIHFRRSGFSGNIDDMVTSVIKDIAIANQNDITAGITADKAIPAYGIKQYMDKHEAELRAHQHLYELLALPPSVSLMPIIYLSKDIHPEPKYIFAPEQETEILNRVGYGKAGMCKLAEADYEYICTEPNWRIDEGTIVLKLGYNFSYLRDTSKVYKKLLFTCKYINDGVEFWLEYRPNNDTRLVVKPLHIDVTIPITIPLTFNKYSYENVIISFKDGRLYISTLLKTIDFPSPFTREVVAISFPDGFTHHSPLVEFIKYNVCIDDDERAFLLS